MPAFPAIFLLVAGAYFTLGGVSILSGKPSITAWLGTFLNKHSGKQKNPSTSREARFWVGLLLTINGPIWFVLGMLASICFFSPSSRYCFF